MEPDVFRQNRRPAASRLGLPGAMRSAERFFRGLPGSAVCTLLLGSPEGAMEMARSVPASRFCVFEGDWDRVDALRERARRAGIEDRVTVRHAAALEVARRGPALS